MARVSIAIAKRIVSACQRWWGDDQAEEVPQNDDEAQADERHPGPGEPLLVTPDTGRDEEPAADQEGHEAQRLRAAQIISQQHRQQVKGGGRDGAGQNDDCDQVDGEHDPPRERWARATSPAAKTSVTVAAIQPARATANSAATMLVASGAPVRGPVTGAPRRVDGEFPVGTDSELFMPARCGTRAWPAPTPADVRAGHRSRSRG